MSERSLKIQLRKLIKEQNKDDFSLAVMPQIVNPTKKTPKFDLTLKQRVLLSLKLCGFTTDEIAEVLNISTTNVKATLSYTKRQLSLQASYKL